MKNKIITLLAMALLINACNNKEEVKNPKPKPEAPLPTVSFVKHAFILSVDSVITFDTIEFFTGKDAGKAYLTDNASADTDDIPSFYISNPEKDINSFSLSDSVVIRMQTFSNDEEGNFRFDEAVSLKTLRQIFSDSRYKHFRNVPFRITIKDSRITEIIEQYIP